ncbi:hypothetical protein NCC49_004784 [Naganishia albida]|nr:hypothetical protein NCC49_004784 [Naganishia albida]
MNQEDVMELGLATEVLNNVLIRGNIRLVAKATEVLNNDLIRGNIRLVAKDILVKGRALWSKYAELARQNNPSHIAAELTSIAGRILYVTIMHAHAASEGMDASERTQMLVEFVEGTGRRGKTLVVEDAGLMTLPAFAPVLDILKKWATAANMEFEDYFDQKASKDGFSTEYTSDEEGQETDGRTGSFEASINLLE